MVAPGINFFLIKNIWSHKLDKEYMLIVVQGNMADKDKKEDEN